MAAKFISDIGGIPNFECSDKRGWKRWLRAFELYAQGKGVVKPEQKKSLLLHTAGMKVQDIYFSLTEEVADENDTGYDVAVKTLNNHMIPQTNLIYERNVFRNMTQLQNETVFDYITRLQHKAEICEFSDPESEIMQQVIDKTSDHAIRCKLLERGNALTFKIMRDIARAHESAREQASTIEESLHH